MTEDPLQELRQLLELAAARDAKIRDYMADALLGEYSYDSDIVPWPVGAALAELIHARRGTPDLVSPYDRAADACARLRKYLADGRELNEVK